jgi:NADH:ubiquinone oxidoreductase subunit 5 (subunit L)/multisubunit Na+/H+ antiporter MnhA subunit
MPKTHWTFFAGWLAICGIIPFSGFWSKDEILGFAWASGGAQGKALWAIGLVTAILTAFYMSRQVFMTFGGRYRYADPTPEEINEAWDTRIAAGVNRADEAGAAVEAARAEVEASAEKVSVAEAALAKAMSDVSAAEQAVGAVAASDLEAARARVESASGKDEKKAAQAALKDLERPGKDLEKARIATGKAETALASAREAQVVAAARVGEVQAEAVAARHEVGEVEAEAARHRPTSSRVSLLDPPDTTGVEDHLPAGVAHRREFHPHESPWTMLLPLVVLALGALAAGVLNLPFNHSTRLLERWLEPSIFGNEASFGLSGAVQWVLAGITAALAIAAIVVAAAIYLRGKGDRRAIEQPVLAHAWYIDDTYAEFVAGPGTAAFDETAAFDRGVIDGAVNGVGRLVNAAAGWLRRAQSGYLRTYALGVAIGAIVLVGLFLSKANF